MAKLDELDRQLAELRANESSVTANLLALEDNPAYKLLCAAGDSLAGVTAQRAKPALAAMLDLWRNFSLLTDLVDRAEKLRGTDKRLSDDRVEELGELLNGHSVPLPRVQVPLAQRGLLSASHVDEAITPADLLAAMTDAFEQARDVVVACESAWNELLPRLDAANADVAALAKQADGLHIPEPQALTLARAALAPIATRIANDPLGAHADLDAAVGGHLKAARADIAARVAERDAVQSGLPAAHQQVADIDALLVAGAAAADAAKTKIKDPAGLVAPLDRARLDELVTALARLDELAGRRDWRSAARELKQWQATASTLAAEAQRIFDANDAPVRRRNELRGLLGASKAKASAVGLGENADVDRLYDDANTALHTTPCDLAAAEALVAQHLKGVRALHAPRPEEKRS